MTKTASIKLTSTINKEGFIAANAILAGLGSDKTHTFINGGVVHSYMDREMNINKVVTVTTGEKIKHRRLTTVPSLSAQSIFKDSFAGRRGFGLRGFNFDCETRESFSKLFSFIAKYAEHLRVDMEISEDKTYGCQLLEIYVETIGTTKESTLRIYANLLDSSVNRVDRGRYPFGF